MNYLWEITDQKVLDINNYEPGQALDGASNSSTAYAIDDMTSATAPGPFVADASSFYNIGSYPAWYGFDRNTGSFWAGNS